MSDFHNSALSSLTNALNNFLPDNIDPEIRRLEMRRRVKLQLEILINWLMRLLGKDSAITLSSKGNYYFQNLDMFEETYNLLKDESSKEKYIELLMYRMLGFTKVKLKLNNDEFWSLRKNVDSFKRPEKIPVSFRNGYLDLYDLSDAGYDIKLYFVRNGIFVDFILQQYNYDDLVCVNSGDVVIDAGGCWGDTALYFAARGAEQVYVYEFIPSNIAIFNQNLSLNPQYAGRINLVEKAVWESSSLTLSFENQGPSSSVAGAGVYDGTTQTLSIDDLVRERGLSKVDFIKMDIEGAELSAIKGAAETIRQHRPKLAVSVYHKHDDLIKIPKYIQSLNPNYEFYLDYYTIVGDEIILYAIDNVSDHAKINN